jgi:hypothetical protein
MPWGPMEELSALFAPGIRHEQAEKQLREVLRDDEGTGDRGRVSTVDLDGNKAVIRLPARPEE